MRTTITTLGLAVALALSPGALLSQSAAGIMDVKACVDYAIEHQPAAVIARNNVEYAQQQEREALSGYLPQVNGNVAFDDNVKRQTTVIPAGALSPTERRVQFGNQYSTNGYVQADQMIYDQTLIAGIQASKPNTAIADLNQQLSQEDIIYNTAFAFTQVMVMKQLEELLAANEEKYNELVPILQLQLDKGVIKQVDFDRVRVGLLNVRSQRATARTNYQLALQRLKTAMGMPLEATLQVPDSSAVSMEASVPATTELDLQTKLEYRVGEQNLLLRGIDLRRKRAQALPTLSAYGRLGVQALGNDLYQSYNALYDYSAVGLKLTVPIFSSLRRTSQVKQSEISLSNAQEQMKLNTASWQLTFASARIKMENNRTQASIDDENLKLAQSVFNNTSLQYQLGYASQSDLLNADYALKEARNNYLTTMFNFWTSVLDLHRSQSTLRQFIATL